MTQTEQHRVVLLPGELPRQGVEVVARLGHVFLWIDPADESVEAVTELRKTYARAEAHTRIPSITLVPGCADGYATVHGLILVVKARVTEKPVEPSCR